MVGYQYLIAKLRTFTPLAPFLNPIPNYNFTLKSSTQYTSSPLPCCPPPLSYAIARYCTFL